jgi:hypothetical protein
MMNKRHRESVEVTCHEFLTQALDGDMDQVHIPANILLWKDPWYPTDGRLGPKNYVLNVCLVVVGYYYKKI